MVGVKGPIFKVVFVVAAVGILFGAIFYAQSISMPEESEVRHIVPLEKVVSGGVPRDGIPSIDGPKFIAAEEADGFLSDSDLVLGLFLEGVARAYPHQILVWHEIVNDEVKGRPLVITYCPLCYTGAAFERTINGEEVEFGVSGKLYNSDLVMYDRKTESYWSQILGQAIVGELAGQKLNRIHIDTVRWADWKRVHPDTQVLSTDTGFVRSYGADPYRSYYASESILFPVDNMDGRLSNKEIVYGVELDGRAKAYPAREVSRVRAVNDTFAGHELLVVWDADLKVVKIFERGLEGAALEFEVRDDRLFDGQTGSEWAFDGEAVAGAYEGERLTRIVSPANFWFAWAAFYPGTELLLLQG